MSAETTVDADAASTHPSFRLIVGECQVETTGATDRTRRGQVIVLVKPDDTVLVHDVDGYKPVAWLTRAETVSTDMESGVITAVDGDQWLRIEIEQPVINRHVPGSAAGRPVDACPECGGTLVEAGQAVHCIGCRSRFGLPTGATLLEERCTCGLPRMRVERGEVIELCIDRTCDPLDARLADRFDGVWSCPDPSCDGTLRVIRRGGLLIGCDEYPDCEESFRFPSGLLEGHCGCGLPRFSRNGETQCLDATCDSTM